MKAERTQTALLTWTLAANDWKCILGIILIIFVSIGSVSALEISRQSPSTFSRHAKGQAAINKLGSRLSFVAAKHGLTKKKLQAALLLDRDLFLDPSDQLIYQCGFGLPDGVVFQDNLEGEDLPGLQASYPLDQTFLLHSRPEASKVIFLDFDGHLTTDASWTPYHNDENIDSQPMDLDGDPSTFSDSEKQLIQDIWLRVVEDFSMYDVDVTTEEPAEEDLRKRINDENYGVRVVISPTLIADFSDAGGVAILGSFTSRYDRPVFVFSSKLGPNNEKFISEAVSHEVGHSLGLSHDGKTDGTEYYGGHGDWAPIMGTGYNKPITQWSRGEYSDANNTEDDLATMLTYGPGYNTDDHGGWIDTATLLSGTDLSADGIIEQEDDLDAFSFSAGGGEISIQVDPAPIDVNLDLSLQLLDEFGNLIIEIDDTTNQGETLSTTVTSGVYYILIDGVGTGDPETGYSDYASLGQYRISGTVQPENTCQPWDSDSDGDVDGKDLSEFVRENSASFLIDFVSRFGETNCY